MNIIVFFTTGLFKNKIRLYIRSSNMRPLSLILPYFFYQNNIHKGRLLYIKAANTEYIFYSPQESKNLSTKSKKFDFKSPFFVHEI